MKLFKSALLVGSVLFTVCTAAAEISANVALATDYRFRGISQSDGEAISGGLDVNFEHGVYLGAWGSSIEDWGNGLELDYYLGYSTDISDALSIDVGYLYYGYPNAADDLDFEELYASVSFAEFTLGATYSDDYFAGTGSYTYLYADYSLALNEQFSLNLHYGDNRIDDEASFGTPDYSDWSIGVSTEYQSLELALSYVDSDLSRAECFGGDDLCEGSLVLNVAASL